MMFITRGGMGKRQEEGWQAGCAIADRRWSSCGAQGSKLCLNVATIKQRTTVNQNYAITGLSLT